MSADLSRDLDAVERWLRELIERTGRGQLLPLLGSPEWLAADEETRLASLARFALVPLAECDPEVIAVRMAAEIVIGRRDDARAMKQASVAISQGADWSRMAARPTRDEVERRRAQPGGARWTA